ncbi:GNAT family N-acetyltransferase [Aminirod propionatiphilus]|uniref:GNAT family N-acetyltransferase n=1 Tax=Aminirod propionatiphilus TaxID=3415223 RepID=A0ACD1DY95_9BACT|nr:GNAT family N-acetyltransferase [Synergistota bacterium]
MNLRMAFDGDEVDWSVVAETLRTVGMASYEPERHERAFRNSAVTVFFYDGERLVAFGRALSDGAYQAVLYDVAVCPDHQGRGLGRAVVKALLERLPAMNVLLYASPGKEPFYEKFAFRQMKTAMARFVDPERARARGFVE